MLISAKLRSIVTNHVLLPGSLLNAWQRQCLLVVTFICASLIGSTCAASHPFHVSVAEMEFNKESRCFEIAMQVWPADLEDALETKFERKLTLESTPDIDELITEYLKDSLQFKTSNDNPGKLRWVGKEVSVKTSWLYFEIEIDGEPDGCEITHRLLFEKYEDHTNLIHFREGNKRTTLTFRREQVSETLDFSKLKSSLADRFCILRQSSAHVISDHSQQQWPTAKVYCGASSRIHCLLYWLERVV